MTDWAIVLQVTNTTILVVLIFFFRSYFPAYFQKKGENKAVREDVGEITSKDESVRSAIAEISDDRKNYLQNQKTSLLEFYDLLIDFFYGRIAVSFGEFPIDQGNSLMNFQNAFHENVLDLMKSYQRIVLYFNHDDDVRVQAEDVLNHVLNARLVMKKHFGSLKSSLIEESHMALTGKTSGIDEIIAASNAANKQYWDAMDPVVSKLSTSLRKYLTALNKYLRPNEFPDIPSNMFKKE